MFRIESTGRTNGLRGTLMVLCGCSLLRGRPAYAHTETDHSEIIQYA